ncbi:unnamed protein product [Chironomus riparius]|uniref:Odorant receptor n=1 Tax=Chironomus riparius TaxID=315576 RepID=A0A9N9S0N2_9DIPT|nr:unnamed protein product [Chironomus riparius]
MRHPCAQKNSVLIDHPVKSELKLKSSMEAFTKARNFLKIKFRSEKSQTSFIVFSDFFMSEKMFDFFGFNNLPLIPSSTESKRKKLVFIVALLSLMILTVLLLTSAIIGFTKSGAVVTLAENICTIAGMTVIIVKVYSILYLYRTNVGGIIDTLESYYPTDGWNQQVFQVSSHLKDLKFLSKLGVLCYVLGFVMFNFIPIFAQLYWLITSQEFELNPIFNFFMPFEQNHPVPYMSINTLALVSHSSGLSFIFMTDLLYAELVALTAMELNIMGQMMSEIDPEENQEKALSELKKLVKVHEELISVSEKLQEVFSLILFMDLFGIIGMMCTLAFLSFIQRKWGKKNDCWVDKEDYDFLDNFLVTEEVVAGKCLMLE